MNDQNRIEEAVQRYRTGTLDRRGFLRAVGIAGISVPSAGALLAACASDDDDSDAGTGSPRSGGRFMEGYDRDFNPLDPVRTAWADPGMNAIYEPLVTRNLDGEIVPFLALDFTFDDEAWIFELPDDRFFHSGDEFTPADVQAAFGQMMDPEQGALAVFWAAVDSIDVDGGNLALRLTRPSPQLAELLAAEYSYIPNTQTRDDVGEGDFGASTADGTGPFTLAEFRPGSRVVVERWDEYPGQGAPFFDNNGAAYLDEVEWVPILEPSTRAAEVETGSVHAVKNPVAADVPRLEQNDGLVVLEFQELSNFVLIPNAGRTELGFDDTRVRQALSHAIDREALVQAIIGGRGVATYGPVFPAWHFYDAVVEDFNEFNPDRARDLLAEAGWEAADGGIRRRNGDSLSFTAINQSDAIENQIMVAIASMLQDVGVEMRVESLEPAAYREQRADAPIFGQKWSWASPMDILRLWLTLYQDTDNPDVQGCLEAFEAWSIASGTDEVATAASAAQLAMAEKVPMIPVYTPNSVWVHHRRVHGWRPNQANLYPFYNDVWLDE